MATATQRLSEIAKTVRSKNAGVDKITFDIVFPDCTTYERVKKSGALTRETVQKLYRVDASRITDFVNYDPGNAIKFTLLRIRTSGSAGDPDIFGSQQYAPLLDLEVPVESK